MRFGLLFLTLSVTLLTGTGSVHSEEPYPIKYWALGDVMMSASISPDGAHLSVIKRPSAKSDPILEIYDSSSLEEPPFRVDADPMRIIGARWVGNSSLVVSLRQRVRSDIQGFNQGVFEGRLALLDIESREMKQFREVNPRIENVLASDPGSIIISFQPDGAGKNRVNPRFRPRSYYELNLDSGEKRLLVRGRSALGQVSFDAQGNARIARGFDARKGELIWYYSDSESGGWQEIYRQSEDSFERFSIAGEHPDKDNMLMAIANNGHDRAALWEFDPSESRVGELIYRHSDVDVQSVSYHSMSWNHPDTIVGAVFATDRVYTAYLDQTEAALESQLRDLVPDSHNLSVRARSRDGKTLLIHNVGPKDPGSFYLLRDGVFSRLGSRNPTLQRDALADVEYIQYEARDGRKIPAYVTVPQGQPPYPLVVMPHGGPFVAEIVSFDDWAQMLANHGYMILQPQYRGSRNYGLEHYKAAFSNGGQGGKKMQDDLDDGALHLVKEGLADKERLAIFGWSYGGYAALVAASRSPQIYQCAVAGAAVTDNLLQVSYYRDRLRGSSREEQLSMWTDSVSPIDRAGDVNIPLMMIHGSVDQRVPIDHSNRFREKLEKSGKSLKYVELEGADHFSNTLDYEHRLEFYGELIGFLDTDCGPNGL